MSERRKLPTMKDVARLADVSVQTISAVINDKPGITPQTRARIFAAIEELGYRPYPVARSLRTRQTRVIAFIVSDVMQHCLATIATAAEAYAHKHDYSLVLYSTHDDIEREASYVQAAIRRWVDGVLFVGASDQITGLDTLHEASIPIVAVDRVPEDYLGPFVTLDNLASGRMAAEHLLDLGHTQIAHIAGPLKLRVARERLAGFRQAIEARGLMPGPWVGGEGNWECAYGYEVTLPVVQQRSHPTAIFAANDRMAIGAMQAVHEAGLRVPEDISIVGLDDLEFAAFQIPPLTTIRQPFTELGTSAVNMLIDLIEVQQPAQLQVVIQPTLVVRKSTAPPPVG